MNLEPIHHSTLELPTGEVRIYKWIGPESSFYEFMTPCCWASAKWYDHGEDGEVFLCRDCKTEVDELHGTAPTTIEELEFIKGLWPLTADEREERLATVR